MTINQYGDPYGNRTRVSAVEGEKRLETRARPLFHVSFPPLYFNGLQGRGDGYAPPDGQKKTPDLAATGSRATKSFPANGERDPTSDGRTSQ